MNRDGKQYLKRAEKTLGVRFFEHHTPGASGSQITTPAAGGIGESRVTYGNAQKLEGFFEGINWLLDSLVYTNPEAIAARLADIAPEAVLEAAKKIKAAKKKGEGMKV